MVTHNFQSKIVSPDDLATYTPLRVGVINSKLHVPFAGTLETLRLFLNEMFAGVSEERSSGGDGSDASAVTTFGLHGEEVKVKLGSSKKGVAVVEWKASPAGDVIADSVVALLMHAQSSTASIRLTSKPCRHPRDGEDDENDDEDHDAGQGQKRPRSAEDNSKERLRFLYSTLKEQFENVEATYEGNKATYEISTDTGSGGTSGAAQQDGGGGGGNDDAVLCTVTVKLDDSSAQRAEISVECADEKLATNVRDSLRNVVAATVPIQSL